VALLAAWVLFPLVLGALALGVGLLVDRIGGGSLPGALLVPVGFAGMLVACRLAVSSDATAELALPAVLVLAVLGFVLAWRRLVSLRPHWLGVAAVLGAAAVYAAPVFLSGDPTFAGYTLLPDTSHQLTLASFLPVHGSEWEQLTNSAYKLELEKYIATAYPLAPQATLGALAPLGFLEVAWLYQPFLTFVAVSLAASLYGLIEPWVTSPGRRAFAAFLAAQPALAVAYALQGSIKELTGCAMLVLVAALCARTIAERWNARAVLPIAVAIAAAGGALGPTAGPYVAAIVLVPAAIWLWRFAHAFSWREAAFGLAAIAAAVLLSLPLLGGASTAIKVNTAVLDNAEDLGNLAAPLPIAEASGVWLNGDYRYEPARGQWLNWVAIAFVLGAAGVGLLWALRRRAIGVLVLVGPLALTSAYLLARGSPYADAKVMMVLSPAILLLAALAPVAFGGFARRVPATLLTAGLAAAVLASNALAYHDVQLAPYDRYEELLEINERLDGRGPVLVTEYDEFSEYMLRDALPYAQPEWPHGYRVNDGYRTNGLLDPAHRPSIKTPLDLDDLKTEYVQSVPTIVLRRSPTVSRPPANYERTFAGRWYEVWRRMPGTEGAVREHVPAGSNVLAPGGRPSCADMRRLAGRAREDGLRIAYSPRPRLPVVQPLELPTPPGWFEYGAYPGCSSRSGPASSGAPCRSRTEAGTGCGSTARSDADSRCWLTADPWVRCATTRATRASTWRSGRWTSLRARTRCCCSAPAATCGRATGAATPACATSGRSCSARR